LGGAISNEIDRIIHGKVIDFINYHHFYIGNIADIFVVLPAIFIFVLILKNISYNDIS
jgi:signal peptidase II